MGWSTNRITGYEKERGYQMFLNKHIWKVLVKHVDHGRTFVKGSCTRQTAQTESPYKVWGLLSSGGTIEAAGCQCTGKDTGTQRPFLPRSEYYKSHNSSDSFSSSDLLQEFMAVSGQRSSYAMVLNPPSQGSPREDLLSPVQR
ncbi:hypothetical protein Pcinc_006906 [Petrolisthes cinctipes]|uniref:Uncharacterized protein n=1 Tax=Petrolisthes cinctipes TaxID=88211 RepID=A0AAE1L115_PETCI|nr:hypothetical protein Pcinc_006906 [Petrolisthes cinctipes]